MTADSITALEPLVTLIVTRAEIAHGYAQVTFKTETVLSIFNDWRLSSEIIAFCNLIGSRLTKVRADMDAVVFEFDIHTKLTVDLSAGAWHGIRHVGNKSRPRIALGESFGITSVGCGFASVQQAIGCILFCSAKGLSI